MKRRLVETVYLLDRRGVDRISEDIWEFLQTLSLENRNRIRIRLAMEDTLLRICEHFGGKISCTVYMDSRMRRDYITIEYEGDRFNPTTLDTGEDEFSRRLMVDMGFAPVWSQRGSKNRVTLRIHEERRFATLTIPISVFAGIFFGILFFQLPDAAGDYIDENVLTLFFNAFLGVFGTFASLSLFLFLGSAVSNLGDIVTYSRYGKRVMNRFINFSFLAAVLAEAVFYPFFTFRTNDSFHLGGSLSEFLRLIASILPSDPISPFAANDSIQLIFMGIALGIGLLAMGESAATLRRVVTQGNSLVNYLMENIGRYSPAFITLTIISYIWNGQISQLYGIWKPVLVYVMGMFLMLVLMLNHTATKYGVEKKWLLKTLKPAMMTSFLTASAGASYGETESIVTRKFGVPSRLTEFALPIGQTMFMPATICSFIATAYYLTEVYHVEVDLTWMIVAIIICTMMAIALPPIPGSGLACYAIMLGRLNIPAGGLGVAIVLDIIFTFIGRAVDCAMLQMELVNSSDALGVLDRKIIRRQK